MPKSSKFRDRVPWGRVLLGLAVVGPPLCIGGVLPWVLPAFALVVAALVVRVCRPGRTSVRWPLGLVWFGLAAGLTALQWAPIGSGAVSFIAPGIAEQTTLALTGTELPAWSRISVLPGATGMELSRVMALGLLFFAAAQMSWRHTATASVVAGTAVALVGIIHRSTGASAIYGMYSPVEVSVFGNARIGILTSFVNPNHQSALLLLGIAAALALLIDAEQRDDRDTRLGLRRPEVGVTLMVALSLQTTVLLLSYSRAALAIALVVYGPALIFLVLRRTERDSPMRFILGTVVAAVAIAFAIDGSQIRTQLGTLLDPQSMEQKFQSVRAGMRLIDFSPWLGTGRGTSVDLLPAVREDLDPVVFTHIESVPVTFIVEWGPVFGGALLLACVGWWGRTLRVSKDTGPRMLVLGILAVALQNCFDFNLEYLGVAAPFFAVAGSVAPLVRRTHPQPRRALLAGGGLATVVACIALSTFDSGRASLHDQHVDVGDGTVGERLALGRRPMDSSVHAKLARLAAEREEWEQVEHRGRVAADLAPSRVEPWLLRGAAATAMDDPRAALEADAEALRRLYIPVEPDLVEYLIGRHDPETLATLLPDDRERVAALLDALLALAPRHADAAAGAWVQSHPDDPFALGHRVEIALASSNSALALHHARLYRAQFPASARATIFVVRALSSFDPPRHAEACTALEQALDQESLDDPGAIEEQLVHGLRRIGTPEALERADAIVSRLLERPAPREVLRRRQRLDPHY